MQVEVGVIIDVKVGSLLLLVVFCKFVLKTRACRNKKRHFGLFSLNNEKKRRKKGTVSTHKMSIGTYQELRNSEQWFWRF